MKITIPEITITVPKLTTMLHHWKGGLLVLLALALMVSWGHQNAQRASADATSEIEFSIAVGAKGNVQIESLRAFDEKQYKSLISNLP